MEIKIIQETKIVGFLVLCPGDQYAKKLTPYLHPSLYCRRNLPIINRDIGLV